MHVCHVFHAAGVRERGLVELAVAQRGRVSCAQLLALGFSRGAIDRLVARCFLHRVLHGVYAVGHPGLAPLAAEAAALLYAGDDTVISHASAAAIWGLCPSPAQVSAIVIGRHVRPQPGVVVHRARTFDVRDVSLHCGLPVTAPARTLLDLAADAAREDLERALNEARVLRLVDDRKLTAALQRAGRRPGTGRLRALLRSGDLPGFTRSESERRLAQVLRGAQLRPTCLNTIVEGCEVDALFAPERVVVEVDGFATHGTRAAFERDRRRDQILVAAGYTVIRVTWRQLMEEPLAFVARLAQALGRTAGRAG